MIEGSALDIGQLHRLLSDSNQSFQRGTGSAPHYVRDMIKI